MARRLPGDGGGGLQPQARAEAGMEGKASVRGPRGVRACWAAPSWCSLGCCTATPPNAYKPFGTGQRACIGRQFALQEATLVLAMLLQRFEFVDFANYQLETKQTLTIKPANFII